jgi:hypothetical protein
MALTPRGQPSLGAVCPLFSSTIRSRPMANLADIKWLKQCERQLREMATEPDQAHFIKQELVKDHELREELSAI